LGLHHEEKKKGYVTFTPEVTFDKKRRVRGKRRRERMAPVIEKGREGFLRKITLY